MKRMALMTLLATFAVFPAWAPSVRAEEPSQPVRIDLKLSSRPPVVHPAPDPEIAKKDAEQAVAEIEERERGQRLIRENILNPPRRPDLTYDVFSGIQSRRLNDALRRR